MAELRTDWLTGRSVLIAENRALRPNEFANSEATGGGVGCAAERISGKFSTPAETAPHSLPTCPFCVGNEARTPPAVYQQMDDDGRWRIRVVPNMFPAVDVGAASLPAVNRPISSRPEVASPSTDLPVPASQQTSLAIGAHEVIIESARHVDRMSALTVLELREILQAYAERLRHWRDDARLRYGLVFKNQGPRAGASLGHLHSQLIALPFVPAAIEAEVARAMYFHEQQKQCAYCSLVEREREARARVVFDRDGLVAFCPFASWQPHEVWLMPADHEPSFEHAQPAALARLACVLHEVLLRIEKIASHSEYNLLLRTAPWRGDYSNACHWRIELLPRQNSLAGLEVGTGVHINPLAPERAAMDLRGS